MKIKITVSLISILFFLIIFSALFANAADADLSPKALITNTTYTFAPVIAGTIITHSFKIQNKGDAMLKIPGIYSE